MARLQLTSRAFLILIAGAILTAGVVKAVSEHIVEVNDGQEITLAAEGFDPRSLLSGHYAQVQYEISRFELPEEKDEGVLSDYDRWTPLWVEIVKGTEGWSVKQVQAASPAAASDDGVWVRARSRGRSVIRLQYGIERIYAQQAEAEALEDLLRSNEDVVEVIASLGTDNRLRLKGLVVNGQRKDFTWW